MPRCPSAAATSSTSRSATAGRRSAGTRSKASARTWLAWVSGTSRPSDQVLPLPGVPGTGGQGGPASGILPDQRGDPGRQPGGVREEGGRDVALVGGDEGVHRAGALAGLQPLTPVEAGVPEVPLVRSRLAGAGGVPLFPRHGLGPVEPGDHRRPVLGQHVDVAVGPVQLPRHEHAGVAPPGRAVEEGDRPLAALVPRGRADVGHRAVGPLVGGHVAQPLGGEPGDVVEECRGGHEQLPVAGPAVPLAVRAVGGDVARVVPEAPHRRVVQRLQPRVAAGEPAGAAQVGVHHDPADVVGGQRSGVALDPGVAEAVGGPAGLEHLTGPPGGDHPVDLAGGQPVRQEGQVGLQVGHRDVAVGVQPLPVGQRQLGAGRAQVGQPQPAVDVLPQVHDEGPGPPAG